jgi:hypothetical protein
MNRDHAINELAIQLLTATSGVYVPGLGVFYKKRDGVQQSALSRKLEPPLIRWYLNRVVINPGTHEALSQWPHPSSVLLDEVPVDWTQAFELQGLGTIVPAGVGEGRLEPEHPLLVHFLASYRFPAIVPPNRAGLQQATSESPNAGMRRKNDVVKWNWSIIGRAALWFMILGPALYLFFQYNIFNDVQHAGVGEVSVRHDSSLLPDFPRLYPPIDSAVEDGAVDAATSVRVAPKSDSLMTLGSTNVLPVEAVVVVGCFLSKRNAERQEWQLKRAGYEPVVVDLTSGGLIRVGAKISVSRAEEVDSFLQLIRANIHPDAWLLETSPHPNPMN